MEYNSAGARTSIVSVRAVEVAIFVLMEAAMWTLMGDLPRWFLIATVVVGAVTILVLEVRDRPGRFYKCAPWICGGLYLAMFVIGLYAIKGPVAYTGTLSYRTILSGRKQVVPMIEIGTSGVIFSDASPGYKLSDLKPFLRDNDFIVKSVNGKLEVSIVILGRNGTPVASISGNQWKVANAPEAWDFNYNRNALEVENDRSRVVLQVVLLADRVQLQAISYRTDGDRAYLVQSHGIQRPRDYALFKFGPPRFSDDTDPDLVIDPIFRYPSSLHRGELLVRAK